jgi:hypothetical protein
MEQSWTFDFEMNSVLFHGSKIRIQFYSHKTQEVAAGGRICHNEDLRNLYSLNNILWGNIQSRTRSMRM